MKNILAICVALIFFALIAAIFVYAASFSMILVYALIGLAVIGAVFVGTGGRAWFGTKEHPGRVLGLSVRFAEIDGLGTCPPTFPNAVLREFKEGSYRAVFSSPIEIESIKENFVDLWPRHAGYPISRVRKRGILAVNGKLESGRCVTALLSKVTK